MLGTVHLVFAIAALKKRMHGKSCFNFTSTDTTLFKELEKLTEAGFMDYRKRGYV